MPTRLFTNTWWLDLRAKRTVIADNTWMCNTSSRTVPAVTEGVRPQSTETNWQLTLHAVAISRNKSAPRRDVFLITAQPQQQVGEYWGFSWVRKLLVWKHLRLWQLVARGLVQTWDLRQIFWSQVYFDARMQRLGSTMPPRRCGTTKGWLWECCSQEEHVRPSTCLLAKPLHYWTVGKGRE